MILIVRHASAGRRGRWDGDDALRPLDDRGHQQANALVELLSPHPVSRVFSSRAVRCLGTVTPLASDRGLKVEEADALFEGSRLEDALGFIGEHNHEDIVLCSHGDVIGDLIMSIERLGGRPIEAPRWAKASTWALTTDGAGLVVAANYLAPPS